MLHKSETVIRINDQQYRLYAAVDRSTNRFLYVLPFSTYTTLLSELFLREPREEHNVEDVLRTRRILMGCTKASLSCTRISGR